MPENPLDVLGKFSNPEHLTGLLRASRAVLKYNSFIDAARVIFDEACRLTGAKSGYVALLSDDGSENEVLFLESGGLPCSVDPELPMPIRGLRSEAYRTGKAAYNNDFMKSEWVKFMPPGHVVLRNVLFAPLNIDGKTVGIMGLANKDGNFTASDASIAEAFGDYAAIALKNSRMMDALQKTVDRLETTLAEVKTLQGFLPICAMCKKIRNDQGYWDQIEDYIREHSQAEFTHGLCPDCMKSLEEDIG